ncbi:MAG TPA: hypothetical protein VNE61_15600 [Ktedonobacteraceae bacterium]|nr:hypothetical protein [Ktedonobacteraceae bacterium]
MMLALSLAWLLLGIIVGLLGIAAKLWPAPWGKRAWLILPAIGVVAALASGWLGTLLLGKLLASAVALWVCVLCVALLPPLAGRLQKRYQIER